MINTLAAVRQLSAAYEVCADTLVPIVQIECPICRHTYDLTQTGRLKEYAEHFGVLWDTHKPDFIVDGTAVQIVRRV
jgi:hypothetical protein